MKKNDEFLKACRREEVAFTPIWMMRQAGRYMEEYRRLREKHSFLEMCKTPDLAVEVTLQPLDRFDLDAAILFADILLPVEAMGIDLEFTEGRGPVLHNPVRNKKDVENLIVIDPEEKVPFVLNAIKMLREELKDRVPLIGFSGAPFTLASYMIEGGSSRNYTITKSMMYNEPEVFASLMDKISEVVKHYLNAQIIAGAQVVQIFDSWVGCLSPEDYKQYIFPHSKKIIDGLIGDVPVIHFANGGSTLLELIKEAGGDVLGVDWRIPLGAAWERIGPDVGIQGNLDPVLLFSNPAEIEKRVKAILEMAGNRPGHIFNLGHGILPKTPLENVDVLIEAVHKHSRR